MAFDINRKGLSKDQIRKIKDNTIFDIEGNEFDVPITATCYRATENIVSLPLGLWRLFINKPPNDTFTRKKYVFSRTLLTKETGKDQDVVAEESISKLLKHSSVFISANTNYGKTTMGVFLFCYFGVRCVVMCHSDVVKGQWIDEFKQTTNALIGGIEDKDCDVSVIGIQQARKLTPEDTKNVGMVIIDEAHMSTATAFTCSLLKFHPRYLIGLSATPDRKDGLDCLFKPYFGKNFIYRFATKNFNVIKYRTGIKPVIVKKIIRNNPSIDWSIVVKSLAENELRQQKIVNIVTSHPKNNIIILSDRVSQSTSLFNKLKEKQEDVEILIGTKRKWNKEARIKIIGMKKGGVGMNDQNANMLIIASDVTDVRQFEGRLRGDGGVIYDIVDDFKRLEDHWKQRKEWYISRGAVIKYKKG